MLVCLMQGIFFIASIIITESPGILSLLIRRRRVIVVSMSNETSNKVCCPKDVVTKRDVANFFGVLFVCVFCIAFVFVVGSVSYRSGFENGVVASLRCQNDGKRYYDFTEEKCR